MKRRDITRGKLAAEKAKRQQRIVCLMSDDEMMIVDRYLELFKSRADHLTDHVINVLGIYDGYVGNVVPCKDIESVVVDVVSCHTFSFQAAFAADFLTKNLLDSETVTNCS